MPGRLLTEQQARYKTHTYLTKQVRNTYRQYVDYRQNSTVVLH